MCPRSSDPLYIITYYIIWVTTSWTYSITTQCNYDNFFTKLMWWLMRPKNVFHLREWRTNRFVEELRSWKSGLTCYCPALSSSRVLRCLFAAFLRRFMSRYKDSLLQDSSMQPQIHRYKLCFYIFIKRLSGSNCALFQGIFLVNIISWRARKRERPPS